MKNIFLSLALILAALTTVRAQPLDCPASFLMTPELALDQDGDGVYADTVVTACVGPTLTEQSAFRHHFGQDGRQYIEVATAMFGGDCDDSDPLAFWLVPGIDVNRPSEGVYVKCVGPRALIDGVWYYYVPHEGFVWSQRIRRRAARR